MAREDPKGSLSDAQIDYLLQKKWRDPRKIRKVKLKMRHLHHLEEEIQRTREKLSILEEIFQETRGQIPLPF